MSDRTPAQTLTAAADKLDTLLAEVYPLPWTEAPVRLVPHRAVFDAKGWEIATVYERSEVARVSALVVALANAGRPLVDLLRNSVPLDGRGHVRPALLALADAILGADHA